LETWFNFVGNMVYFCWKHGLLQRPYFYTYGLTSFWLKNIHNLDFSTGTLTLYRFAKKANANM